MCWHILLTCICVQCMHAVPKGARRERSYRCCQPLQGWELKNSVLSTWPLLGLQIIPFRLQVLTFFTWSFPEKEAVIFLRSGLSRYPVSHAFVVSSENLLGHEDFLLWLLRVALLKQNTDSTQWFLELYSCLSPFLTWTFLSSVKEPWSPLLAILHFFLREQLASPLCMLVRWFWTFYATIYAVRSLCGWLLSLVCAFSVHLCRSTFPWHSNVSWSGWTTVCFVIY